MGGGDETQLRLSLPKGARVRGQREMEEEVSSTYPFPKPADIPLLLRVGGGRRRRRPAAAAAAADAPKKTDREEGEREKRKRFSLPDPRPTVRAASPVIHCGEEGYKEGKKRKEEVWLFLPPSPSIFLSHFSPPLSLSILTMRRPPRARAAWERGTDGGTDGSQS